MKYIKCINRDCNTEMTLGDIIWIEKSLEKFEPYLEGDKIAYWSANQDVIWQSGWACRKCDCYQKNITDKYVKKLLKEDLHG